MKTKEIKIEVPAGYTVKGFNKETNTLEIEKETISLFQKLIEKYNINTEGLEDDEIAFKILKKVTAEVNGDWKADFKNSDQVKYYPYFNMDNFSVYDWHWYFSNSYAPDRLCFKSEQLCKDTVNKYLEIYKIYFNA